jgi:phosphate transport system permease protein
VTTMQTNTPARTKPWINRTASVRDLVLPVAIAAVIASALNLLTGLAGALGFYLAFVLSYVVVAVIFGLRHDKVRAIDKLASALITLGFATAFIPWSSILITVFRRGWPAIHGGYFSNDMRVTAADDDLAMGGLSHALVGTILMLVIASVISIPLGVLTAAYITEIRGRLAGFVRIMVQSMSGVPSIVAGLFIYATVVARFKFGGLAGALALSILMLPTIARTAEEVLKLVPEEIRSASYALGASQMATTFRIILPAARSGLVTASMLGVARVAGETAPLILTAFYSAVFSLKLVGEPIGSLPMYTYQNFGVGTDTALTRAWGGALVLMVLILVLFSAARLFAGRGNK